MEGSRLRTCAACGNSTQIGIRGWRMVQLVSPHPAKAGFLLVDFAAPFSLCRVRVSPGRIAPLSDIEPRVFFGVGARISETAGGRRWPVRMGSMCALTKSGSAPGLPNQTGPGDQSLGRVSTFLWSHPVDGKPAMTSPASGMLKKDARNVSRETKPAAAVACFT